PTGFFLEMEQALSSLGAPTLPEAEMERGLEMACQRLLSLGVTSVHEATPSNALAHWDRLRSMEEWGRLPLRVYKMVGPDDLDELHRRDLFFGAGDPGLSIGAVKIMLNETGDRVLPDRDVLEEQVYAAHQAGYQVAFHAVEEGGIEAALDAVEAALRRSLDDAPHVAALGLRLQDHRHRIEHCGVCPPELVRRIRALGLAVVTQPGFIAEHGERYLAQVPESKQPWLYPIAALAQAGIKVAFGSDCPVAPPGPLAAIGAAVTRRAGNGSLVSPRQRVALLEALVMHTAAGAYASSDEHDRGSIAPGRLADLVLLDTDLLETPAEAIGDTGVEWTMIGGAMVWERSSTAAAG
ncbi:MAG: amidohydrolase family protein, partial [Dehalococcoidia bacterium]